MAADGARVAVLDVNEAAATVVAEEIGGLAFGVDVTDYDAVEGALRATADAFGGLTILFNNAGTANQSKLHDYSLEEWHRIVGVCLTGVFHGFKAGAPLMLASGGGSIVSTASISGTRPAAGEGPYSAAKAAVAALTATAALEYAPTIRVNAVAPGMIHTGLTDPLVQGLPEFAGSFVDRTPLRRIGQPEDIADVVVFLCSDHARFITGQNLVVDGGLTLHGSGVDGLADHLEERLGTRTG